MGSTDWKLYAVRAEDGTLAWNQTLRHPNGTQHGGGTNDASNDASSDGSPGQAKGDEYIPEFTPAKIGGLTAALVFVSFCCFVKLVLLVRNVVTAHRANAEPSSAV